MLVVHFQIFALITTYLNDKSQSTNGFLMHQQIESTIHVQSEQCVEY